MEKCRPKCEAERILTPERSREMKRRNSRKREEKREMEGVGGCRD